MRTRDYGPRDGSDLELWMRTLLAEQGIAADGEIWLQTFLRVFGYAFNPAASGTATTPTAACAPCWRRSTTPSAKPTATCCAWPTTAAPRIASRCVSPFCQLTGHYAFRFHTTGARRAPASITTTTTAC
jgi:hypothetical protein